MLLLLQQQSHDSLGQTFKRRPHEVVAVDGALLGKVTVPATVAAAAAGRERLILGVVFQILVGPPL